MMNYLTTEDVAARLGVAASTVRAYNSRGQMPAPTGHVGRTPYWSPEDIEPWLEQRSTQVARSTPDQ
jgi:predicted DNA-binding transcriptional regulator AlpA